MTKIFALEGLFSKPGIFNKMSRIFERQPWIYFVSAWTQHYMPLPHKPREANQTIQDRWVVHHCLEVFVSMLYKLSKLPLVSITL
jgi:hypothetical protein